MRRRVTVGLAALVWAITGLAGCGGKGARSSGATTTTVPSGPGGLPAVAIGTSVTTTGPLPTTATGGATLPVGPATTEVFGSVPDVVGLPSSDLPPNAMQVDQSRVDTAPLLPAINLSLTSTSQWPAICTITDQAQLMALEPSITGLRGQPVGKDTLGPLGGSSPRNNQCTYNLTTVFDTELSAQYPSSVTLALEDVASNGAATYATGEQMDAASKLGPTAFVNYGNLGNGLSCYDDGGSLTCDKGDVVFDVDGTKNTEGEYADVDAAVWIDQIELPLAEVLARELTGT